jgi:resuscitation-promoting factor RpfB
MTPPEMDEDDSTYIGGEGNGLLAWIVGSLVLAFVVFAAWAAVALDTKDEQKIDAERRYEQIKEMPVPTVTQIVQTPGPVRTKIVTTPGPTVTVRVTERASRSSARSTVNRAKTDSSIPTTGRYRFTVNGLDLRHRDFWMCVHAREGSWTDNSGFEGGLQFMNATWLWAGGAYFAKHAYQATPNQQITVANWLSNGARTGIRHNWPNTGPPCARKFGMTVR